VITSLAEAAGNPSPPETAAVSAFFARAGRGAAAFEEVVDLGAIDEI